MCRCFFTPVIPGPQPVFVGAPVPISRWRRVFGLPAANPNLPRPSHFSVWNRRCAPLTGRVAVGHPGIGRVPLTVAGRVVPGSG